MLLPEPSMFYRIVKLTTRELLRSRLTSQPSTHLNHQNSHLRRRFITQI